MPNWKKLIVSGSDATLSNLTVVNNVDASTYSGDGSNLTFIGTNLVSGSSQVDITNLNGYTAFSSSVENSISQLSPASTYRQSITGATSYTVTHSLNETFCQISVFDNNKQLTLPATVAAIDSNNVSVSFDESFTGTIVVKS
jgi:hypothetical protein|tara:strand:+ start:244 stop:669 length:426 start_codon:yes stop_codon:yes gene_type:complete